jgi:hypothetical protein
LRLNNTLLQDTYQYKNNIEPPEFKRTADYLVKNEYDGVLATYWNSIVTSAHTNGELKFGHFENGFSPYLWVVDAKVYYNDYKGKWALIFTDDELPTYLNSQDAYVREIMDNNAIFDTKIGNLNIYSIYFNPVNAFKMPVFKNESYEYSFVKSYAAKASRTIVETKNMYIESVHSGTIVNGPNIKSKKGKYELTVSYEYLDDSDGTIFMAYSNAAKTRYISELLPTGQNKFTVLLDLPGDVDNLEFVASNREDSHIRLYDIIITKK